MKIFQYVSFILIFIIAANVTFPQVEDSWDENPFYKAPDFFYDILQFEAKDTSATKTDIFIHVPFNKIQFLKSGDQFTAKYSVTITIMDEYRDKVLFERYWNEKVTLDNFEQTNARNNFNLSLQSFTLDPGTYVFLFSVEDKDSRNQYNTDYLFTIRPIPEDTLAISDIMLIANRSEVNGKSRIIPNVSRNVANQEDGIEIFYEIYSNKEQALSLEYQVLDKEKEVVYEDDVEKNVSEAKTQVFYKLEDFDISVGDYQIVLKAKTEEGENPIIITKPFFSRWMGVPSTEEDLKDAANQMVYLTSSNDIDYILEAETFEEQLERYIAWWKAKDPSPTTGENELFKEYYRRVAYANKHFSQLMDGWRTDMGMVYIILGPPNNVERHPFEYDSKPYEVWQYYELNRQFVFVDYTGFGDYRLATPFYGDYYFR